MATKKPFDRRSQGSVSGVRCFIIHSYRDGQAYAGLLAERLQAAGVDIISASDIRVGTLWLEAINGMMNAADVVVLIGTSQALASRAVYHELGFCLRSKIPVLPVVFPSTAAPDVPDLLASIQWLREGNEASQGPSNEAVAKLVNALQYLALDSKRGAHQVDARRSDEKKRPLNEGKLILVGRGEVGKTSLVRRLVEGGFNGNESKTQGIRITRWFVPFSKDVIRLNVWDFGGQEIMHATHQFFMTERSLYLLTLNGREGGEDADAEYWLKHIETFGGTSPVIVVQNKIAQHPFELNYRGLLSRYPQIRGFVKTDCRVDVGILELRELVESVVGGMPEVQMKMPADWFRVKESLESIKREFLGYHEFVDICSAEGITSESDRDALAFALHCLGLVLNYKDDARLRETSVLKPEWVTEGVYSLLNAERFAQRQGELRLVDLRDVLPKDRYPRDKHLFLLELMRKFSLCFPFQDDSERYLIPELLGKEEPKEVAAFQPDSCLNFEYHYGVLPEGLLPRFIVRTHTLSQGQQRWRTGVILAHDESTALVKVEPASRRVVVRVKGRDAGSRRDLLAIIRYDFDRINAEFKDRLEVQAKVPLGENPLFSIDYKKLVAFEKQGVKEFPEFVGQRVVTVRVKELLDGVDFEKQRDDSLDALERSRSVFFSYSHKDERLRDELETHLKLLQRQGIISTWHDRKVLPGNEWDGEIDSELDRANIILLLVSADFIASDYCWDKEVKRALERHEAQRAKVVPILLRSCDWKSAPFGKLQGLPTEMKAVTNWADRDAAWTDVAAGIRKIAESLPTTKAFAAF